MRSITLALLAWLAPVAALAGSPPAHSGPDGTIVQIENDLAYIDVGGATGLRVGQVVHVLRTVTAKHPVSGAALIDHFPLGVMTLVEVGHVLSYGRVDKPLVGVVKVGDVVRFVAAAPSQPPPDPARPEASTGEKEVSRVWWLTRGRQPGERVRILQRYLETHPGSEFAAALQEEIVRFGEIDRALRDAETRVQAAEAKASTHSSVEPAKPEESLLSILLALPERIYPGDPLEVAFVTRTPERVQAAFVYARRPDKIPYERIRLKAEGGGYFRALVPAELVAPPEVDLFIEAIDQGGATITDGDVEHPHRIVVEELPVGPLSPGPGHSAVRGFFEYVDWNRLRSNDYHLVAESDFMYRIGELLYGVRTGFGVQYGRGGRVVELDSGTGLCDPKVPDGSSCGREVGFNYGYVEAELRFGRLVGLSGRLLGGQTVKGPGVGAEVKVRIGPETGTNLVVGGSVLSDLGALALLALEWDVIHGWPMSATVVVTNQPAGQDIGVRFVYQIAYRAKPWFQPALRIGYDARNIDHGGPSFGLGVVMGW